MQIRGVPAFAAAFSDHAKLKRLARTCIDRGPAALAVGWTAHRQCKKQPSSGEVFRRERIFAQRAVGDDSS